MDRRAPPCRTDEELRAEELRGLRSAAELVSGRAGLTPSLPGAWTQRPVVNPVPPEAGSDVPGKLFGLPEPSPWEGSVVTCLEQREPHHLADDVLASGAGVGGT